MKRHRKTPSKLALTLAAVLAGGSVFSTCQTRVKDAFVDGSTTFVFSLLDPSVVIGLLTDQPAEANGS